MLDRKNFSYCADIDRCAVATGAETVEIWRLPEGAEGPTATEPDAAIETGRSPLRGLTFVSARHVMTVHQLGECIIWRLPEPREPAADSQDESDDGDLPAPSDAGSEGASPKEGDLTTTGEQTPAKAPGEPPEIPRAEKVWSKNLGFEIATFQARTRGGAAADRVAVGGREGDLVVGVVDAGGDRPLRFGTVDAHESDVTCMSFAPRSERLATGGRDNRIAVWSTDPGDFRSRDADESDDGSSGPAEGGGQSEPAPDADEGGGADGDPAVGARETLDAPALPKQLVLEGSEGWPLAIEFSGDGTRLASTALDNALYLWDPRADEPLQGVVNRHDNWVPELAWSPDDSHIATGSWDASIGLFQAADLTPRFRFEVHTDFVSGLAFLSESQRLVSASYDGTLGVWNWSDGELVDRIRAHADWIEVLVALDGGRVLTVSSEDVLRIWDVEAAEQLAELGDASFEGFELGRAVDFSDYVEVPELSSELLGGDRESGVTFDAVEKLSGRDAPGAAEEKRTRTAVGLLENAIETSLQENPPAQLGDGTSGAGKELLESRLEGADSPPSGDETSSGGSKLPEPDSPDAPEPADEDEVEEAFSEISEIDLDQLKKKGGADSSSSDEQSSGSAASDPEPDSGEPESVDQFGESIDERVGDTSLDMPDELDTGSDSEPSGIAETEKLEGVGTSASNEQGDAESSVGSTADQPTLGEQPSPQLGPPPGDSARNRRNDESAPEDASPKLGQPAGRSRGEGRSEDVGQDTIPASGPTGVDPDRDVGSAGSNRDETSTASGAPSSKEDTDGTDSSPGESAPGSDAESERAGDAESEPTASELKKKFRKLKESKSEDASDSD